ncbi:MAG TPA: aminopeptidase P N-terminal domain-containing protein [Bacteroidales bacterium]|nr:aminopeptidase P N-terminal domain-containing protein [Bacteroidales bacterium]
MNDTNIVYPNLFQRNRKKLINLLPQHALVCISSNDLMPRNGDQYFPYRQNSDLFYLTGIGQEKTILILFPSHADEKMKEILFILRPDETTEIWEGQKLRLEEASQISGMANIRYTDQFEATLKDLMVLTSNVFIDSNEYPKFFPEVKVNEHRFALKIRKMFPLHTFSRLAPLLWKLRLNKEPEEIEFIRRASQLTGNCFRKILKITSPGMFEHEIEAEITYEFARNGCCHAFQPTVASGANACYLHYRSHQQKLEKGDLLLLDFGAEYKNYASDCSRTIPISGKFTPRQLQVYEAVLRLQRHALSMLVPGNTINQVNDELNHLAEKEMINLGLFSEDDLLHQDPQNPLRTKFFMHGVSHFVGLDVHDVGSRDEVFSPGMILTFEPGLYIPEENIGIRLENTFVVGYPSYNLMEDIPIDPDEIEELMIKPK